MDQHDKNTAISITHSFARLSLPFDYPSATDVRTQLLNKFYHLKFCAHFAATLHDSSEDQR
jgi:hypothetical protein